MGPNTQQENLYARTEEVTQQPPSRSADHLGADVHWQRLGDMRQGWTQLRGDASAEHAPSATWWGPAQWAQRDTQASPCNVIPSTCTNTGSATHVLPTPTKHPPLCIWGRKHRPKERKKLQGWQLCSAARLDCHLSSLRTSLRKSTTHERNGQVLLVNWKASILRRLSNWEGIALGPNQPGFLLHHSFLTRELFCKMRTRDSSAWGKSHKSTAQKK